MKIWYLFYTPGKYVIHNLMEQCLDDTCSRPYYEEIESENGHDAFLIDFDQVDDYLRSFLQ